MPEPVYIVPVERARDYRGRQIVVRCHDPSALTGAFTERDLGNLAGVQLLSLDASIEPLANWGYAIPVDLVMREPRRESPLLYRHAKLLDKHPLRASIPAVPGCRQAVSIATSLQFVVKLDLGQPGPEVIEELSEVLDRYLHHPLVSQPVEPFHSALLSLFHSAQYTFWDIQEDDPAVVRYVTDDGQETLAREPVSERPGDLRRFLSDFQRQLLSGNSECHGCPYFGGCGGYFKWPNRDYTCDGVKGLFRMLGAAVLEIERDLAGCPEQAEGLR